MTSMRQTSVPLPINIYDRAADLESGRTAPCAYAQATGNSTACEQPASRVTPPSSQPPTTPSPHSRFIDGLRRRTRLRSLNVPSHGHENLDSDLGFPPVCSPPPPPSDSAGSQPPEACGSRTRRRTMSDAAQTCGLNFNGTNKRHSGVLVIFPHSPSAHGDYLQGHSTPAAGNKRQSSYGSSASKSFEAFPCSSWLVLILAFESLKQCSYVVFFFNE
ncbi:unnamed protein product [Haemonchus placei]|uniref:Uncharacterized protein n=1 Tax=Haemonchus placei TaxID=6290 RepID=A0A0N4WQZ9_HAEPC|nr:unnamed protein product [Haemonchus placei]